MNYPKGKSNGLHKGYFNGSPEHSGPKPNPAPAQPPVVPTTKGC